MSALREPFHTISLIADTAVRDYIAPMSTVQEIKAAIATLSPAERAELDFWLHETHRPLDPEVDSPELEAELLKAAEGPFTPYSSEEFRELGEQIIRERRKK